MFKRFAAVVAAGVLVVTGLAAGTAHAAAPFTDTVRITGNFDNGNHGYWARLAYDRTVTIDRTGHNTWSVTLRDAGTFTTLRGAKSPEAGATLGAPVSGTFSGSYAYTVESERRPSDRFVRSAYNFRCNPAGSGDRTADCPSMPKSTSEWPALYFPPGSTFAPGAWRWEYRTECERWVNSSAGDRGDITGKRCVRPGTPTAADPACDTQRGKVVIPSERGVTYKVRADKHPWHVARAGEYPVRPGVYWVRAEAKDGYRLVGKALWRLTVREAEPCPTPTPTPTDEPPATPTPTEEPSEEPTETPSEEPSETPSEEPAKPAPTVTQTITSTVVVNNIPVPSRVDTGFGGLAR